MYHYIKILNNFVEESTNSRSTYRPTNFVDCFILYLLYNISLKNS